MNGREESDRGRRSRRPSEGPVRFEKAREKERLFAHAYVALNRNGLRAAIEAGYAEPSAAQTAHDLLKKPYVREMIRSYTDEKLAKLDIRAERTLAEIARIAYLGDMASFAEWGPEGVTLFQSDTLPAALTGLVESVSQTKTQHGGTIKLKLFDKVSALRDLAKIQGLLEEGDDTPEQRARAIRDALESLNREMTTTPP
ncbi:MAG: terminase small subunit [Longimicrobiales bacterium]